MEIYLFNKVFNNKYLFKLIYKYVHCNNSILNWKIKELLEKQEYDKFDQLFNVYFNIFKTNKSQIVINENWFYQITPTQNDVIQLLRYRELGISRFIQFYQEFKHLFNSIKKKVLNESIKSGNMEIIEYLKSEKFQYEPYKSNVFNNGFIPQYLDCGNSIDVFNLILKSNPQIKLDESLALALLEFYSEKQRGYSNLYYILVYLISSERKLYQAIGFSFQNNDKKLALELSKHPLIRRSEFIKQFIDKSNLIIDNDYYIILSIYLKNIENGEDFLKLIENTSFKSKSKKEKDIYQLKLWEENDQLLLELILNCYFPNTLKEFKFIMEKQNLRFILFKRYNLYLFATHLSTEICELEYVKYFLEQYLVFINENDDEYGTRLEQYYSCCKVLCDSTLEISNYMLNEIMNQTIASFNNGYYIYSNAYFGNLEMLKLANNKFGSINIEFSLLSTAAYNGYIDIVEYLHQSLKPETRLYSGALIKCNDNNQFKTFKYLIDNDRIHLNECKEQFEQNLSPIGKLELKPSFLHYLYKSNVIKSIQQFQEHSYNNLEIFNLFNKLNGSRLLDKYSDFIENSNIQVFKELINLEYNDGQGNSGLILSNYLNTVELKEQFISSCIKSDFKKLIYFILNSSIEIINEYYLIILKKVLFSILSSSVSVIIISHLIKTFSKSPFLKEFNFNIIYHLILFNNKKGLIKEFQTLLISSDFDCTQFKDFINHLSNSESTNTQFHNNYSKLLKDGVINNLNI